MEVNHYPFTTKRIHLGHFTFRRLQYQLVDTPGLLDRPMEKRNDIEMQAISALENLGSLVLFLIDESEQCGMTVEEQNNLLEEILQLLAETTVMVVSTKADLHKQKPENWDAVVNAEKEYLDEGEEHYTDLPLLLDSSGYVTISALQNVGLEALKMEVIRIVKDNTPVDPMSLPDGWYRSN
jgi:nucleolar GTP-binding protein